MDDRSACEVFISHAQLALCCPAIAQADPDLTEADTLPARQHASDLLAYLSGWTVFGVCSARVRPQGTMKIDEHDAIPLTWPVRSIESVYVNGTALLPSQYALIDKRYLVRTDQLWWPCHQWVFRQASEWWTFEINYTFGTDIPWIAVMAAAELACEYLEGCESGECLLPTTARSLSTQGFSLDLAAVETRSAVNGGDLRAVTEFLALCNPTGQMPTQVYSPDVPKLRVVEFFSDPS